MVSYCKLLRGCALLVLGDAFMSRHKLWVINDKDVVDSVLHESSVYSLLSFGDRIELRADLPLSPEMICALLPTSSLRSGDWVLLTPDYNAWQLRVNGMLVPAGIRVLRHKDVISISAGHELIYSGEFVESEVFSGEPARCRFCLDPLRAGEQIVCCPRCQAPHHLDCWRHTAHCATLHCSMPSRTCWQPEVVL